MRHLDLFSGIGGFSLAARNIWGDEHEVVSFCDIEPFAQKVLKKHWPDVPCHDDIKTMKGTDYANIDLLTGGFPCQPYSQAGQRRGSEDDRHLWPEMLRIIRESKPRWVVGENVRGLTNWNEGVVFDEVLSDLETEGYRVQPFLLPACAVDAPHRRERIWIVAHAGHAESQGRYKTKEGQQFGRGRNAWSESASLCGDVPNSNNERLQGSEIIGSIGGIRQNQDQFFTRCIPSTWQNFPTQPPVCGGNDGLPTKLDGITFPKWRNESIKAYGNAIVPAVVEQIFKAIKSFDN